MRSAAIAALLLPPGVLAGCTVGAEDLLGRGGQYDVFSQDGLPETGAPSSLLGRFEVCDNGFDDDQNGMVDDGCVCDIGSTQSCYPGWPEWAGIGVCARGSMTCVARGSVGSWDECTGEITRSPETCDGLDDDCDGAIDEGCPCEPGAVQDCFGGTASQAGVGACARGTQTCVVGGEFPSWSACSGGTLASDEICNAIDDDCDGSIDDLVERCNLEDDDCDGAVDEGACSGLPPSWALTRYWSGGSGVLPGTAPLHRMVATTPVDCPAPNVLVEVMPNVVLCAPPPPMCPPGTRYSWVDGAWACVECPVIVQMGYLFSYERTCAPEPRITCPAGETPTYRVETREWECLPMCDDTEYDRAFHDGMLVCIPC